MNSSARKEWKGDVEDAGQAEDHVLGRPQAFQRADHGVERIGDADDEGVGRVFGAGADCHFGLVPSRSSRLMPGLRATPAVTIQTLAPSIAS